MSQPSDGSLVSNTSSTWADLSPEIWLLIIDKLREDGIRYMALLGKTAQRFHVLVKPILLKHLVVDFTSDEYHESYEALLESSFEDLASYTLTLEIVLPPFSYLENGDTRDTLLCALLEACLNLQDLHWRGEPPKECMSTQQLQKHHANLRLHFMMENTMCQLSTTKLATCFDKIKTLHLEIADLPTHSQFHLEHLGDAIAQCSSLETLYLEILPALAQARFGDQLAFENSHTSFPPIRDLTLISYTWPDYYEIDHKYWNFSKIERLIFYNIALSSFFTNSSFAKSDLSHLTELVLGDLDSGYLVSMQGNDISFRETQRAAKEVWTRAVNLRSLTLTSRWRALCPVDCFELLGSKLRELTLLVRKVKWHGRIWTEPKNSVLYAEDLEALCKACPNLTKLHFATPLSGSANHLRPQLVNILSRFQRLRDLRIEDDEFLGHDLAYGRWVNIPTKREGLETAKSFFKQLFKAKEGHFYRRIVVVTSGRYSKEEDYDQLCFRKHESDGVKIGHDEVFSYKEEPTVVLRIPLFDEEVA